MANRRGPNEGTICKRKDGRWVAVVNLGWEDGKRKRKSYYGETYEEVRGKLSDATKKRDDNIPLGDGRMTVESYLNTWLEQVVKPNCKPLTYATYKSIVDNHLNKGIGTAKLAKLTPAQVRGLLNKRRDNGLSVRRVQLIREVLRNALNQAMKDGLVSRNVAALASGPKTVKNPVNPFDPEEVQTFLRAAKNDRLEALWTLTLATGLREGEVLALRWEDVDLEAGLLQVRHALQRVKGQGLQLVTPKSRSSLRTVAIPKIAVESLRQHRLKQKQEAAWGRKRWQDTGHVFTTKIGTALDSHRLWVEYKKLLKAAGLRDQRFHDLRHCCASLLLTQGVSPRTVMETLGHSQISLTMNTYSHVVDALKQDAADRMDAALTGQKGH
ncbi:MAG: site-specific integrase [Actinobacteria bacterium]|nr:site-specific integrase [Actinomycetota bacterium]